MFYDSLTFVRLYNIILRLFQIFGNFLSILCYTNAYVIVILYVLVSSVSLPVSRPSLDWGFTKKHLLMESQNQNGFAMAGH